MTDTPETDKKEPILNPESSVSTSEAAYRRDAFRHITLPLLGAFLVLVLLQAVVLISPLLPHAKQVSTVSNIMLTLCLLLPLFLCALPLYLLLAYVVWGLGVFNNASARQLRRLHRLTTRVTDGTIQQTEVINRHTVNARVKIAGVEAAMNNTFKPEEHASEKNAQGESDDRQSE